MVDEILYKLAEREIRKTEAKWERKIRKIEAKLEFQISLDKLIDLVDEEIESARCRGLTTVKINTYAIMRNETKKNRKALSKKVIKSYSKNGYYIDPTYDYCGFVIELDKSRKLEFLEAAVKFITSD